MSTTGKIQFNFPDPELAEPDGLLAVGGNLAPETLITAYANGIFPWYNEGQPLLWWCPDPRTVLYPEQVHISRSLGKLLRKGKYQVTCDLAFERVIKACAGVRINNPGGESWITADMEKAYIHLHRIGIAHSVECWQDERLAGGLYGISLGSIFFGESMFSNESDASKVALVYICRHLAEKFIRLIDCQVSSDHILSMGATMIPRRDFLEIVRGGTREAEPQDLWLPGAILNGVAKTSDE
jgi:leucyl/phenylalanyl-tRNA--protein transferase